MSGAVPHVRMASDVPDAVPARLQHTQGQLSSAQGDEYQLRQIHRTSAQTTKRPSQATRGLSAETAPPMAEELLYGLKRTWRTNTYTTSSAMTTKSYGLQSQLGPARR